MKQLAVGILAHVDAGKTTLSEAMLYESGSIKIPGRVDDGNAFLDVESIERERGITVFSKQAVLKCGDETITLLDTPGHVDFSAEMERTIWVMDYAVLVISASDGIQGHTMTLWRLLETYGIPVFIFVNKMDQPGVEKERLLGELQKNFGEGCIDFTDTKSSQFLEQIAVCDENLLEQYLEKGVLTDEQVADMVKRRLVFPCFFGSALHFSGIHEFMAGLIKYAVPYSDGTAAGSGELPKDAFGARVFKIARDSQGNRLTYMKVTKGKLKVRDMVGETEKVNQIRIYSGANYELVQEAGCGVVCAVTGLAKTKPGTGLGIESRAALPILEPVVTYTVEPVGDVDAIWLLARLRELSEELPELAVVWQEETSEIHVKLMGEVQMEVLTRTIADRFGVEVRFGKETILYKETICNTVEGVGHFEPLKHYAEVHVKLEPGERGSGIQVLTDCREDLLDRNWQRLIMAHLEEKEHAGVLTGSVLTDVRMTVAAGKAHAKHTEGGDFRQAAYRAVRQGLMQAESQLLEPYYTFRLQVPVSLVGRAMTDIDNMYGKAEPPVIDGDMAELKGTVPVSAVGDYQITVSAYTKGKGSFFCTLAGYGPCHNAEEVIAGFDYHPEADLENPSSSVFCAHGSGYIVPWNEVTAHMHVESVLADENRGMDAQSVFTPDTSLQEEFLDDEQIEMILNRTSRANEKPGKRAYKKHKSLPDTTYKGKGKPGHQDKYLIVDGYNIVHAWDELNCLTQDNLDGARMKLLDILCNYQAFVKMEVIVVFDAYKVKGGLGEMFDYHNIHVVYTKEAETADTYIEKLTHQISGNYQVTVATSDGLIQLITRGQNCIVMSARELKSEIEETERKIREYMKASRH